MKLTTQVSILKRVSFQEKLLFTKHLDTMIKAGIPIAEALETLVDQAKSPYFKKTIKSILNSVENGQSLAKSLKKHPKAFDQFYVSLVSVGEESGTLEENLGFLAKQLSKDFRLRKKIQGALIYPALVMSASIILGAFVSFFILPKLVEFFSSFEVELPLSTKILLFIANLMKNYGVVIFIALVVFVVVVRVVTRMSIVRPKWHGVILRLPIIGKMLLYGQLSRFSRNLGTLITSGVPISRSLQITVDTLSNLRFKEDLNYVAKDLLKGKNIGDTLIKKDFFEYPPIVSRMISIGEKTGKLDETLLYLSDFYEDEVDDMSKNMSTVLEPILLVGIALAVGFLALAIISPIYELTGSIHN